MPWRFRLAGSAVKQVDNINVRTGADTVSLTHLAAGAPDRALTQELAGQGRGESTSAVTIPRRHRVRSARPRPEHQGWVCTSSD
jgi:hypothetical protein